MQVTRTAMGRDQTLYPSSLALAKASSDSVVRLSNLRALPMGPIQAVSAICSSRCDLLQVPGRIEILTTQGRLKGHHE